MANIKLWLMVSFYIRVSTVSAPEVTHPPHWHHHPDNPHEKRQTTQHLIIMRMKKVIMTATVIVIVVVMMMMMMMATCYMFTNPFSPRNLKARPLPAESSPNACGSPSVRAKELGNRNSNESTLLI